MPSFLKELHDARMSYIAQHDKAPVAVVVSSVHASAVAHIQGMSIAFDPQLQPSQIIFFDVSKHFQRYVTSIPSAA